MPDDKAALQYLAASASAISVKADVDGAAIVTGYNANDEAIVEVFWCPPGRARSIAARARSIAGDNPDVDTAISAVRSAAAESRTTITLHHVAIARAAEMSTVLDHCLDDMKRSGALKTFNQMFKARRAAASAQGRGYMSYRVAELRLRKALAASLASSGNARAAAASLKFAAAFEGARYRRRHGSH
jgi:hypothetical protein